MNTYRLRNDNVLLRIRPPAETTARFGIVIPATANEPREIDAVHADVVAVGPGHYGAGKLGDKAPCLVGEFVPCSVKPGDHVLLDSALAGNYVNEKGDPWLRVVRESEIHAVIEDSPARPEADESSAA